jgi:hypothetical protein
MVSCSVKASESTQNSIDWSIDRSTYEHDGVQSVEKFEFIEIIDGSQPYPALMGLE